MSVTVPESTWRELARRLADDIDAAGKMHNPEWRAAVQEVPRHVFVPRYYTDDQQGWSLHEPKDPDSVRRWLELVYSRTTLVTQVADFADRGGGVQLTQLDGGARFPFLAQLHLPPGVLRSIWRRESGDGATVTELRAPDGSWTEVTREPDSQARYHVREAGSTPLWAHVETAWEQWVDLGALQWHEFGLTATPTTASRSLGERRPPPVRPRPGTASRP